MIKRLALLLSLLMVATLSPATAGTKKKHPPRAASQSQHPSRHASKKSRKARTRGQQAIDHERATEIQQALIREHYLAGSPSGSWDAATEHAMQRYQQDQGFQAKSVPDSRALIRLGLGPSHDHLLNPESAMTSEPWPVPQSSQTSAAAVSVNRAVASSPSGSPIAVGSSAASPATGAGGQLSSPVR
jgi:peptidoglycan hydrolase-like protein with peptidoglycan-binding domain